MSRDCCGQGRRKRVTAIVDRQSLRLHVLSEDADDALSARQLQSSAGSTIRNGFQVGIVDAALEVIKRPTEAVLYILYHIR